MLYRKLRINDIDYPLAVNISGRGAPTEDIEAEIGMFYTDEDTGETYKKTADGWVNTEARLTELENIVADLTYEEIAIKSFSVNPSTAEMGSSVDTISASWTFNKTPTSITFAGKSYEPTATSGYVVGPFTATQSFNLVATDERDASARKSTSLSFLNGVYFGAAAQPNAVDSTFILTLSKGLRSSKLTQFTTNASAGRYIWYCLPKRMGTCSFKVGGFEGGFTLHSTISFTNASGYTEDYYVYRSDNDGLGQTTVTIS